MRAGDHRPALNCLRALAALAVLLYHLKFYAAVPVIELYPQLWYGHMGVDFFFILSGLIISHVYFAPIASGQVSYREFLFLRLSRLFPVHALLMVLMLAAVLAGGRMLTAAEATDWLTLTLLFRQWLLPEQYAWNSAAWSISAEMFAYALVFPAVVAATRRAGARAAAYALIGLGSLLYLLLLVAYGQVPEDGGFGPLLRVTAGFLVGAGLYRRLAETAPTARADALIVAGLALVLLGVRVGAQLEVVAGLAVMIVGAYLSRGPIARAMAHRVPFYLGEISFSLYLVHLPLFKAGTRLADSLGVERGYPFCVALLAAAFAAAALLYETVEMPARGALRSWWRRRAGRSSGITGPAGLTGTRR